MKTQNNNQETGLSQVSKLTLRAGAVLFSAVMISASVDAQDLWEQLSGTVSYGKMALTMDEQSTETSNADAAIKAIHSELNYQLDLNGESFAAEEGEEPMQAENGMTDEILLNEAEQYTNESVDQEIAKYAEKIIQIEKEETMSVESWMTNEELFMDAQQYTADGVDQEIAKYAERLLLSEEKEQALVVESWMTDENFFKEAEQYTADGSDQEIAKYAKKMTQKEEAEEALMIENWMLDTKKFSNNLAYDQFAIR